MRALNAGSVKSRPRFSIVSNKSSIDNFYTKQNFVSVVDTFSIIFKKAVYKEHIFCILE